ncbi:MAG: RNA-binding protein [Gammaproteobacteria bacterium]|nr:RNA-binding protein [Gammaproteobacteria bacterium]
MDIFVGNLPKKTSVLELRKLIGDVGSARFRVITGKQKNGRKCCYGHAIIGSSQTGTEVITRLDGVEFNGCSITARHFLHRSEHNERRSRMVYPIGWNGVNRRRGDRRAHI